MIPLFVGLPLTVRKKKVTSHLARHTFATLALTKGVSIESVSKILGYTNIQTTQIYVRISR